jgi:hypothetical protein
VAVPTTTPSTFTCTLLIAVPIADVLSNAHPLTVTTPLTTAPGAGDSMFTDGGGTVTITFAVEVSGVASVSVAVTVMVCCPELREAVFNW